MIYTGFNKEHSALLLKTIINSSIDVLILVVDPDYNLMLFNEAWKQATFSAYSTEPEQGENLFKFILNDDDKAKAKVYIRKALNGENFNITEEFGDTQKFHFDVTYNPVRDIDGKIIGAAIFTKDITNKIEAQNKLEKTLNLNNSLLFELRHRIKNNLSLILSIIDIESSEYESTEFHNALTDLRCRVSSIAELYDLINNLDAVSSVDLSDYLLEIFKSVKRLYSRQEIMLNETIELSEAFISARKALPIGLILNEILTNSFKYAFESRNKGTVKIILENEEDFLTLIVSDDGPGLSESRISNMNKEGGIGRTLINILSLQLDASLDVKSDNGFEYRLQIPLNTPLK